MNKKNIKKGLRIIGVIVFVVVFYINNTNYKSLLPDSNLTTLLKLKIANAEWTWGEPWSWEGPWGLEEDLEPCALYRPNGSFTSSVEVVCKEIECEIPMSCDCTPIPCGQ